MFRCFLALAVAIWLLGVGLTGAPQAAPAPKLSDTEKDQLELQRMWCGVTMERDIGKTDLHDITSAQKIINWIQGQRHTERRGVGNSSQCEPANGTTSAASAAFANATLPCYRATTPRGHYPSGRC